MLFCCCSIDKWFFLLLFFRMVRASIWSCVVRNAQSVEEGLSLIDKETSTDEVVLPCAPTDEEKYSFLETHRTWIVGYGIVSCVPLCAGMWLFAFADVDFEFFTVPALLITLYLATSYFGVSVWGKDYDMVEHRRIVQHAKLTKFKPTVDVYLPCCGEPIAVLHNTYEHVSKLDYEKTLLTVYVLDDSGRAMVQELAAMYGYRYMCRDDRPHLKKAGNLRYAFSRTQGDVILILDADFCPRSDLLQEMVPHMTDAEVAIVQSPQFFRWRKEQSWVEQAAGSSQEVFYRSSISECDLSFCTNNVCVLVFTSLYCCLFQRMTGSSRLTARCMMLQFAWAHQQYTDVLLWSYSAALQRLAIVKI